jgi:hypothetical protein
MAKETKITKRMVLEALVAAYEENLDTVVGTVIGAEENIEITGADVVDYAELTIAQMDKKADGAKKRAAEKRAEGDELKAAVASVLTGELQTIADITAQIEGEDVTASKITARLTQLVKAGEAYKEKIKVGTRTVMGYALPAAENAEDEVVENEAGEAVTE